MEHVIVSADSIIKKKKFFLSLLLNERKNATEAIFVFYENFSGRKKWFKIILFFRNIFGKIHGDMII